MTVVCDTIQYYTGFNLLLPFNFFIGHSDLHRVLQFHSKRDLFSCISGLGLHYHIQLVAKHFFGDMTKTRTVFSVCWTVYSAFLQNLKRHVADTNLWLHVAIISIQELRDPGFTYYWRCCSNG